MCLILGSLGLLLVPNIHQGVRLADEHIVQPVKRNVVDPGRRLGKRYIGDPLRSGANRVAGSAVNAGAWVLNAVPHKRSRDLEAVRSGKVPVDPRSRLGAYQATLGYAPGTVGYAANKHIGNIYNVLGTSGEDRIGIVFNSPEAQRLLSQPVSGKANRQLAELEYGYWKQQNQRGTLGGFMGTRFRPGSRAWLQEYAAGANDN